MIKPTIAILNIKHIHKEKEVIDFLTTITYESAKRIKFILTCTSLPLLIFKSLNENEIQYLNDNCECINLKSYQNEKN